MKNIFDKWEMFLIFFKVHKKSISILNESDEVVNIDVRFQTRSNDNQSKLQLPGIIICPGFMAYKNWGPFPFYGKWFADAGFCSIIINYSHNGVNENNKLKITDFDKFSKNTISKEIEDINAVLNFISKGNELPINGNSIGLLGHSKGAANALLVAVENPVVKFLISWASIAYFDRWTEHQKLDWKKNGYLPLTKDYQTNPLRMNYGYYQDFKNNEDRFDLIKAVNKLTIPWLIIHGEEDMVAKINEAKILYDAADKSNTEFLKIAKVGHSFSATVPFDENNETMNKVLNLTLTWLKKQKI